MTCSVDGCDRPTRARGWCYRHWQRNRRNGHPTNPPERKPRSDATSHGSRTLYDLGCRCFPCRVGASQAWRTWKEEGPVRVDAAPVARHVDALLADGWTLTAIAREAGVGHNTPSAVRRQATCLPRVADAILALPLTDHRKTLPAKPLVSAVRAAGVDLKKVFTAAERRSFQRAAQDGYLSETMADRLAIKALGTPLELLYDADLLESA